MRKWIDIIGLMETRTHRIDLYHDLPFTVWENPTAEQAEMIGPEVRGIMDQDGNILVWDAYRGTHVDVADKLGIRLLYQFTLLGKSVHEGDIEFDDNENFKRAFPGVSMEQHWHDRTQIAEGYLKTIEVRPEWGKWGPIPVDVFENPNQREFSQIMVAAKHKVVRANLYEGDRLIVWDADSVEHHYIDYEIMGEGQRHYERLFLYPDRVSFYSLEGLVADDHIDRKIASELYGSQALRRIYGKNLVIVDDGNEVYPLVESFGSSPKLYHGTSIDNVVQIVSSGVFEPAGSDGYGDGISLTRNLETAESFARSTEHGYDDQLSYYFNADIETRDFRHGAVVEFDRARLLGKGHEIKEIDYHGDGSEAEERVLGSIHGLDCVSAIYVDREDLEWYEESLHARLRANPGCKGSARDLRSLEALKRSPLLKDR